MTIKIGIIGAGFSGTALAANLHRFSSAPIEIFLFEKRGYFGTGEAYSTPYPFHLLNVLARDMSVFEDDASHFVNWLKANQNVQAYLNHAPPEEQFVPRLLYGCYLQDLLNTIQADRSGKTTLTMVPTEVIDVVPEEGRAKLILRDQTEMRMDKVAFALGNPPPSPFPFPVSSDVNCIHKPWEYTAPQQIDKNAPVLIVGTGLSMIDVVLTLHHQGHQGAIYALSRHGLLPLAHANQSVPPLSLENLPIQLRSLTRKVRETSQAQLEKGGDWRSILNGLRLHVPMIWSAASVQDKKRFLRHVLPYWNIHRHRVHRKLADLLEQLSKQQQLHILAGRILKVEQGEATIALRHTHQTKQIKLQWLINCMGPSLSLAITQQPLIDAMLQRDVAMFDPLRLGFDITSVGSLKNKAGVSSPIFYTLGPIAKSLYWESGAVPEIRKQSFNLARHLLEIR